MPTLTIIGAILALVGLLGFLAIIVKKIPILAKLQNLPSFEKAGFSEAVKIRLKGLKYSTYRPLILDWLEKNLRKLRLAILKLDNLFIGWIKGSREKSQVWTIRSKAWLEYNRLRKKEKMQVLEKMDKVQISDGLEKISQEVAKDEDKALNEKIANINEELESQDAADAAEPVQEEIVSDDEKKYIDLIANNPKDEDAYRFLGFIYLRRKNYSDARACFRRVLKLDPQDADIQNKLAEIKGLRGKKAPAVLENK